MTDIRNLQAFALYIQKTDVKFDLYSITKEMETQVHIISVFLFVIECRLPFSFSFFLSLSLSLSLSLVSSSDIGLIFCSTPEDDSILKRLDISC